MPTTTLDACASDATDTNPTPKGLGKHGLAKWYRMSQQIVQNRKNMELLVLAVGAWEDWVQASEELNSASVEGTGGTTKVNPALDAKISAGKFYRQLLRDIEWSDGSTPDDDETGRPRDIDD